MPIYTLRGVQVDFPFNAYDCQLVYMERVIQALQTGQNALLESPTGTGKTLCLLCATLAWRESLKLANAPPAPAETQAPQAQVAGNWQSTSGALALSGGGFTSAGPLSQAPDGNRLQSLPTIVYSSRTHSQLQQVIKELKATNYRPKSSILGSREQLCVHHDVSKLRGVAQNTTCRATVQARGCRHNLEIEPFLHGNPDFGAEPLDIEDLVTIGREIGPCPYYLSRELMAAGAEILFMPYNYLIDKKHRETLKGVSWANTVLIFDEAHNLEGICADAASFDLPALHLTQCISEAGRCVELASQASASGFAGGDKSASAENFLTLKHLLLKLEDKIKEVPLKGQEGFTRPGPWLLEFLGELNINYETVRLLDETIDEATALLADDAADKGARSGARQTSYRLSSLSEALRKAFTTEDSMLGPGQTPGGSSSSYRVHIHEGGATPGRANRAGGPSQRTLSYWCFDPGTCFREFARMGVKSVVVTSGTLAPLDSFAHELKLPFQVRLENPHVIQPSQVWAGIIPVGPSGKALNSSYKTRDSPEYKSELGNAIVNFARIVPDGLLVFFPSYHLLTSSMEFWQTPSDGAPTTIWERITRYKQPVVEPRESALFNQANEDFYAKLDDSAASGAVFFAVCRGKVSEGLDFADKAGRAVIITGMPYAMKLDPKIRLKMEFLDDNARARGQVVHGQKALSGDQWYVQLATRAVNQAVGRVIRHRNDYGAIILCDERFGQHNMQNQLSLWLRPYLRRYSKFGEASFTLTQFFRDQAAALPPVAPRAETGPFGGVKKRLRTEESEGEFGGRGGGGENGRRARPHIEVSFEELAGNAGFTSGGLPGSGPAPDSSSRPGGILAILAANKGDHPGTSYRALKDQKRGSLSTLLAANRAQAAPEPLPAGVMLSEATITPANAAIGSMAGVVRAEKREGLGVLRDVEGAISGAKEEGLRDSGAGGGATSGGRETEVGKSSARFEVNGAESGGKAGNGQSGAERIEDVQGVRGRTSRSPVTLEPSGRDAAVGSRGVHKQRLGLSGKDGDDRHAHGSADVSRGDRIDGRRQEEPRVGGGALLLNGKAGIAGGRGLAKDAQSKEMRKRANAMEFLKQVKSELDASDFETFRTLLTDFKKGSVPIEALLDGVVPLFASKERWNLLAGFGTIIKPADRPLLQRKIEALKRRRPNVGTDEIGASHEKTRDCGPQRDHVSRSAPSGRALDSQIKGNGLDDEFDGSVGQPSSAGVGEGRRAPSNTGNGTYARTIVQDSVDRKSSQEVSKGRSCASCQKRPPDKAFKAACGHICCYTCWLKIVDRTKMCPTCGSRVNKAALQKLYF